MQNVARARGSGSGLGGAPPYGAAFAGGGAGTPATGQLATPMVSRVMDSLMARACSGSATHVL